MFSGKELECRSLACFVIGGIITVIFIKMLEWQRSQNYEEQEGEERIIVPVQEVGDGEGQEERILQGCTVNMTKFPQEQDEL